MIKKILSANPHSPPLTIQQHIIEEQQRFPQASGEFSFLLSGITLAAKQIQAQVSRAGLNNVLGEYGSENIQGESQQKLDVMANDLMIQSLASRQSVGVLASEENETPLILPHRSKEASYAVVFDPLDGSSNIDVNVSVGTTFSIFRKPDGVGFEEPEKWVLQPGTKQIGAGYVVYGSSTVMVYTVGHGVHGFTLDPNIGAFVLSHENMKMPNQGKYYSVNEAYQKSFPDSYNRFISKLQSGEVGGTLYSSRYIGSLVADFHRTLLRGGIFMYPPTQAHPNGKLRLLYEANPIAFIAEQAGGIAMSGNQRILEVDPTDVHQRVGLQVGSKFEMEALANELAAEG